MSITRAPTLESGQDQVTVTPKKGISALLRLRSHPRELRMTVCILQIYYHFHSDFLGQAPDTPDMTLNLIEKVWPNDASVERLLKVYKEIENRDEKMRARHGDDPQPFLHRVWLSPAIGKWSPDSRSTITADAESLREVIEEASPGLLICGIRQFEGYDSDEEFVWLLLLYLIELAWDLTEDEWKFLRHLEQNPTPPELEYTPRRSSRLVAIRSDIHRPRHDSLLKSPSRLDQTFALRYRWGCKAPVYQGGVHFFVWHPLDKRPVLQSVSVLILLSKSPGSRKAFITASSKLFPRLQDEFELPGPCSRRLLTTEAQLYLLILTICETMLADVLVCIAEAQQESERMVSCVYRSKH